MCIAKSFGCLAERILHGMDGRSHVPAESLTRTTPRSRRQTSTSPSTSTGNATKLIAEKSARRSRWSQPPDLLQAISPYSLSVLVIQGGGDDARNIRPDCCRRHRLAAVREETHRPAAASRARRSPFERFVEAAYHRVSSPPFFLACVAIVVAWLVSLPLWSDTKAWQVAIHTVASVITLLLVALLENAGRRSAEAAQEKLNVIAEALAALMASRAVEDQNLEEAVTRLRDAVGLEERH
jgi:low affinity Fe/Cu permease